MYFLIYPTMCCGNKFIFFYSVIQRLSFSDSSPEFVRRSSLNNDREQQQDDDSFLEIMDDQSEVSFCFMSFSLKFFFIVQANFGVILPPVLWHAE